MVAIAVICGLLAAAFNAVAAILQRQATGQVKPRELFRHRIVTKVLRNKLWLGGVGLEVIAFFAQALALYNGTLVLVAPLMTTDLIFLFVFLHFGLGRRFSRREWLAVVILVTGLSALLITANPKGGNITFSLINWLILLVIFSLVIAAGMVLMRRGPEIRIRAAIGGFTAGAHFSLTAALTKLVVDQLSNHGAWYLFTSWELYLLAVVGISSVITVQSMYGSGSLAVSQPALEITEVFAGILIGIYVFGDSIRHSPPAIAVEVLSGLALAAGIVMLAGSKRVQQVQNT